MPINLSICLEKGTLIKNELSECPGKAEARVHPLTHLCIVHSKHKNTKQDAEDWGCLLQGDKVLGLIALTGIEGSSGHVECWVIWKARWVIRPQSKRPEELNRQLALPFLQMRTKPLHAPQKVNLHSEFPFFFF